MTRVWLLLHLLGFTMWIGGALGVFVSGIAGRREDRAGLGAIVRGQSLVYRVIVGPGALLTVLAGILLTFRNSGMRFAGADVWLILMQGAGVVAGLLTLFISVPTASKLGRLDPSGKTGPYFDELRARQKMVSTIAGTLALVALVAGMMVTHGG
jgi:flagellar biosynthesis component FlhA